MTLLLRVLVICNLLYLLLVFHSKVEEDTVYILKTLITSWFGYMSIFQLVSPQRWHHQCFQQQSFRKMHYIRHSGAYKLIALSCTWLTQEAMTLHVTMLTSFAFTCIEFGIFLFSPECFKQSFVQFLILMNSLVLAMIITLVYMV